MNKLFICFNAFLLLFLFLAVALVQVISFKDTVNSLENKINAINLNPVFIVAIIITIIYFYVMLNAETYSKNKDLYLSLLSIISVTLLGIPFLVFLKNYFKQSLTFIYNIVIFGVIMLMFFGSLLIMYSLCTSMYQKYAYISTIGLAAFTAMTMLVFHQPVNKTELTSFLKNLSILGGLMLLSQQFNIV